MGGDEILNGGAWSYISPERRVPEDHPLRPIRVTVDRVLEELTPRFNRLYAENGWASIPPEQILRAVLLQFLYGIRNDGLLVEQFEYNLLFRWFVGLNVDGPTWNSSAFKSNRERLIKDKTAQKFLEAVLKELRPTNLLADEHFMVGDVFQSVQSGPPSTVPTATDGERLLA